MALKIARRVAPALFRLKEQFTSVFLITITSPHMAGSDLEMISLGSAGTEVPEIRKFILWRGAEARVPLKANMVSFTSGTRFFPVSAPPNSAWQAFSEHVAEGHEQGLGPANKLCQDGIT